MKILIIGPSPYMKHDPGLMVNDFIKLASKDRQVFGCFYHHDFSKLPLENTNEFHYGSGSIDAKWIDNSQENAAVIAAYDAIMEWEIDCIVSFGSYIEADFIRAAKETSGREIAWHHVLTMANHVHDVRYAETFNNIDFIYSFSESQLDNIVSTFGVLKDKLECMEEKSTLKDDIDFLKNKSDQIKSANFYFSLVYRIEKKKVMKEQIDLIYMIKNFINEII